MPQSRTSVPASPRPSCLSRIHSDRQNTSESSEITSRGPIYTRWFIRDYSQASDHKAVIINWQADSATRAQAGANTARSCYVSLPGDVSVSAPVDCGDPASYSAPGCTTQCGGLACPASRDCKGCQFHASILFLTSEIYTDLKVQDYRTPHPTRRRTRYHRCSPRWRNAHRAPTRGHRHAHADARRSPVCLFSFLSRTRYLQSFLVIWTGQNAVGTSVGSLARQFRLPTNVAGSSSLTPDRLFPTPFTVQYTALSIRPKYLQKATFRPTNPDRTVQANPTLVAVEGAQGEVVVVAVSRPHPHRTPSTAPHPHKTSPTPA